MKNKNDRAERLYDELGSADENYLREALSCEDARSLSSEKAQKTRRATILTPARRRALLSAACLALAAGVIITVFAVWGAANKPAPGEEPPAPSVTQETSIGESGLHAHTPAHSGDASEQNTPSPPSAPETVGPVVDPTEGETSSQPDDNTQNNETPFVPEIDTIDEVIYYGAMAAFNRKSNGYMNVHRRKASVRLNDPTTPIPTEIAYPEDEQYEPQVYDFYPDSQITIYSAYYFSIRLYEGTGFDLITSKVGTGQIRVLVTSNSIDRMLTFISADGKSFFSCLSCAQHERDGVEYYDFTPSRCTDANSIVYVPHNVMLYATVVVKDGQVVEFELSIEKCVDNTTYSTGLTVLSEGIQMYTSDAFTFTLAQLRAYWRDNSFYAPDLRVDPVPNDRETGCEIGQTLLFPAGKVTHAGLYVSRNAYFANGLSAVSPIVELLSKLELSPCRAEPNSSDESRTIKLFYEGGKSHTVVFKDKYVIAEDGQVYALELPDYDNLRALFDDYYVPDNYTIWGYESDPQEVSFVNAPAFDYKAEREEALKQQYEFTTVITEELTPKSEFYFPIARDAIEYAENFVLPEKNIRPYYNIRYSVAFFFDQTEMIWKLVFSSFKNSGDVATVYIGLNGTTELIVVNMALPTPEPSDTDVTVVYPTHTPTPDAVPTTPTPEEVPTETFSYPTAEATVTAYTQTPAPPEPVDTDVTTDLESFPQVIED